MEVNKEKQLSAETPEEIDMEVAIKVLHELTPELFKQMSETPYGSVPETEWQQETEKLVEKLNADAGIRYKQKIEEKYNR